MWPLMAICSWPRPVTTFREDGSGLLSARRAGKILARYGVEKACDACFGVLGKGGAPATRTPETY